MACNGTDQDYPQGFVKAPRHTRTYTELFWFQRRIAIKDWRPRQSPLALKDEARKRSLCIVTYRRSLENLLKRKSSSAAVVRQCRRGGAGTAGTLLEPPDGGLEGADQLGSSAEKARTRLNELGLLDVLLGRRRN
ncbi:uncharacterized protein J3R85_001886 [Psidium guajava]|nr:uncharacterized protein J3R85_001886 [Psidium guajava]